MRTVHILSHKVSHKLKLAPKLIQALYMLRLTTPRLREYLIRHIEENPLLQDMSTKDLSIKINSLLASHVSGKDYHADYYAESSKENSRCLEDHASDAISLYDHLLHQLKMTFLNNGELRIGEEIISNLDGNGYLRMSLEIIPKNMNSSVKSVEKVLGVIQMFEPYGIAARNLRECLLIQLKNTGRENSLAYSIIKSHFKKFAKKRYSDIAKKMGIEVEEVIKAAKEIGFLNPRPGMSFVKDSSVFIVPDAIVKRDKNRIKVILNDKELPQLRINSQYVKLLNDPSTSQKIKEFVAERLKAALWLVKSMEERRKNTLAVIKAIIAAQSQAILKGLSYIKPLTMGKIAEMTGLHRSTVSRIVFEKYISTPCGTIKLKDLFSGRYISKDGASVSRKAVLFKIQNIMARENKRTSLIDREISNILLKKGISISRRTISKYRAILRISPSFLRQY